MRGHSGAHRMAHRADVVIQMAMEAEAAPVVRALGLINPEPLAPPLAAQVWAGEHAGLQVRLVTHGRDPRFGVDAIGTQPAAVTAWVACERYRPAILLNAGTAGGFARAGAAIGDVYVSDGPVAFHDRRVPLGPFEACGVGSYPCLDCLSLAATLGLKLGQLTTGDSLDLCDADARAIEASGATVKDMEAASIAWVASIWATPFVALKAITDLVDGEHAATEAFVRNLDLAVRRLAERVPAVLEWLALHVKMGNLANRP
jgi:5'-methylthioadenosine nucleosidase